MLSAKLRHGRHLESVTSDRKSDSVNRWVFTWRTILSKFISLCKIKFFLLFFRSVLKRRRGHPNKMKKNKMSRDNGISSWSNKEALIQEKVLATIYSFYWLCGAYFRPTLFYPLNYAEERVEGWQPTWVRRRRKLMRNNHGQKNVNKLQTTHCW